jgi:spermidine synthase
VRGAGPAPVRRIVWLLTPLLTGAVGMSLEVIAFRLYASFFGYSIFVWGGMITGVMAAMAAGYYAGGWLADSRDTDRWLYGVILFASAYQFLMILAARPLLTWLSGSADSGAALVATLIVFGPSVGALSVTIPFVVRLLSDTERIGSATGRVYAVSTIGSIGGVLTTSFYLLPAWGTSASLKTACAVSAFAGMAGTVGGSRRILPLAALIVGLPLLPAGASPANVIWASESAYNLVRVEKDFGRLLLKLNQENSVHTVQATGGGWTQLYYDYFALGPLLAKPRRLLVLGMGAGGSITSTRAIAPDIDIDAVEIDDKVIEAATRFFGLNAQDPKLRIHRADARPWLARADGTYDIIQLDLYQGGPYIPFYLVTLEFFRMARQHMTDGGVLMMNLFDVGRSAEILHTTVATMSRIFPTVAVVTVGRGNFMVMAFTEGQSIETIRARMLGAAAGGPAWSIASAAAMSIHEDEISQAGAIVFSDDHAPIEEMTRRMLRSHSL